MGEPTEDTSPSPVFDVVTGMVTLADGWLLRLMVKVAVPPFSFVFPEIVETMNPATSLSEMVTVAEDGVMLV
jgi:hypothetical protein